MNKDLTQLKNIENIPGLCYHKSTNFHYHFVKNDEKTIDIYCFSRLPTIPSFTEASKQYNSGCYIASYHIESTFVLLSATQEAKNELYDYLCEELTKNDLM